MIESSAVHAFLPIGLIMLIGGSLIGCDADVEPEAVVVRCPTPAQAGIGNPLTITDAVALMNALPAPVDVACVLEALDRPLSIAATSSGASAQPASGHADPRIFIFTEGLTLSVVTGGPGTHLLEFGEIINDEESIKGELHMPAEHPIGAGKPFEHLRFKDSDTTTCGLCHQGERTSDLGFELAKISPAFRPRNHEILPLETLRAARRSCTDPSRRCQILKAIFDHGPVVEGQFPETWPTFFGE